jgi:NTP pyrophosphatase (non-canonical NTP hydrolase)|nr:MAG TPA_asm: triphosphate pyrophosphohydrolase [Caudoviricetes sp.]
MEKSQKDLSTRDLLAIMRKNCKRDYLYRQLAEECAELAQAALKVVRAQNGETPEKLEDAMDHYIEELADVFVMTGISRLDLNATQISKMYKIMGDKRERMAERLVSRGKTQKAPAKNAESTERDFKEMGAEIGQKAKGIMEGLCNAFGIDLAELMEDDEDD